MTATGVLNPNSQMKDYGRPFAYLAPAPLPRDAQIRNAAALLRAVWNLRKSHLRQGDLLRARAYSPIVSGKIAELRKLKGDMK